MSVPKFEPGTSKTLYMGVIHYDVTLIKFADNILLHKKLIYVLKVHIKTR
jgi:hypothetical protein